MLDTAFNIFLTIVGFGSLIFVHELGHFIAAKWTGVRVEKFALGFGCPIASYRYGDTIYALCWIPIGGYVKMSGQADVPGEEVVTGAPYEYTSKKIWQRALIVVAGVTMNTIFAVVLLTALFFHGFERMSTRVGSVETAKTFQAGLRPGDTILSVNGNDTECFEELNFNVMLKTIGEKVPVKVRTAEGVEKVYTVPVQKSPILESIGAIQVKPTFTLRVSNKLDTKKIKDICPGLKPGNWIVAANGKSLDTFDADTFVKLVRDNPEIPIQIEVLDASSVVKNETGIYVPVPNAERKSLVFTPKKNLYYDFGAYCSVYIADNEESLLKDSPAQIAGLRPGDKIVALKCSTTGDKIELNRGIRQFLEAVNKFTKDIVVYVERTENKQTVTEEINVKDLYEMSRGKFRLGIIPWSMLPKNQEGFVVDYIRPKSPADGELQIGDIILEVNGEKVVGDDKNGNRAIQHELEEIKEIDSTQKTEEKALALKLKVKRGSETKTVNLSYAKIPDDVKPPVGNFPPELLDTDKLVIVARGDNFFEKTADALRLSYKECWMVTCNTYLALYKLINGSLSHKAMNGPVMMIKFTYNSAEMGFQTWFWFLALISLALAIFNLLPIPILDGGLLLFLIIEKLRGRPVSAKFQNAVSYVAFFFLIALMLFVTFNDITMLVK